MKKDLLKLSLAAMMVGMSAPAHAEMNMEALNNLQLPEIVTDNMPSVEETTKFIQENMYGLEAEQLFLYSILQAYSAGKVVGEWQSEFPGMPEGETGDYVKGGVIAIETLALARLTYGGVKVTNKMISGIVGQNAPLKALRESKSQLRAARKELKAISKVNDAARSAQLEKISRIEARISGIRTGVPSLAGRARRVLTRTLRRTTVVGVGVVAFASFAGGNAAGIFFPEDFEMVEDLIKNRIAEIDLQLMLLNEDGEE